MILYTVSKGGMMKRSFAILFVLVAMAFVMNTAFADSSNCSPTHEPIYTETGASIR